MLQRMFLTEERAQLQRDRQLARDDPSTYCHHEVIYIAAADMTLKAGEAGVNGCILV